MNKKDITRLIDYHLPNLEHFIEQTAHPIYVVPGEEKELLSLCPWLCKRQNGTIALDKSHPIPDDLLAAFWKFKYEETSNDYFTIMAKIDELRNY